MSTNATKNSGPSPAAGSGLLLTISGAISGDSSLHEGVLVALHSDANKKVHNHCVQAQLHFTSAFVFSSALRR